MPSPAADNDRTWPDTARPLFPLRETRLTWLGYSLVIGVMALIFFYGLASHPFDMDDDSYLQDSAAMSADFSSILSPSRFPGRPAVNLVFWVEHSLWGERASGYHLLVVFFHTLASLLLARAARRTGATLETALLSGLIFLVNVAHFRAVYWISAIAYPLALTLSLAAVLCYLRFLDRQRPGWLVGTYLFLFMAALAHPASAAAWLFCLFLAWRRVELDLALKQLAFLGAMLVTSILAMAYFYPESPPVKVTMRLPGLLEPVQQFLWFWSRLLTTAHWLPLSIYRYDTWELLPGVLALTGFVVLLWRRVTPTLEWGVWTFIATLPFLTLVSSHVKDLPQGGPSRFIYLASAGTSVLMAWSLQRGGAWLAGKNLAWGRLALIAALLGLLVSSFTALQRLHAFSYYSEGRNYIAAGDGERGIAQLKLAIAHDPEVIPLDDTYIRLSMHLIGTPDFKPLIEEALEQFPDDLYLNTYNLVSQSMTANPSLQEQAFSQLEELAKSTSDAQKADLMQIIAQGYHNLGMSLHKRGDLEKAATAYKLSLRFHPEYLISYDRLGAILMKLDRPQEAEMVYRQAVLRTQDNAELYHNLGRAQLAIGDRQGATAAFEKALSLGSDYLATYIGLGNLYQQNGRTGEIITLYDRALRSDLKGAGSPLYAKMGDDLLALGRADMASTAFQRALDQDPNNLTATVNLGWCCYLRGDLQEAIDYYRRALALQPSSQAQFNLGLAYLRLGQVAPARQAYAEGVKKYGAAEAEKIGAVADLKHLIGQGIQVDEAQRLLSTYWR